MTDRMSSADWQRLSIQLGRYALQRSRRFYWRTGSNGELPYGEVTESLVSKALLLWMTGQRRWNQSEYDDLQTFLMGVIDSLLSHAASGFDNRNFETRAELTHVSDATPEHQLLAKEREDRAGRLLSELVAETEADPVAREILDAMRRGVSTRRDLVNTTGRSADEIDNGLKRLRRAGARIAQAEKERSL